MGSRRHCSNPRRTGASNRLHPFEQALSVAAADLEVLLHGHGLAPWDSFVLNPRRLRGSDFLMRWSQGVWSEERLVEALDNSGLYLALPYGPSSVAPADDVRAFELYFERLEAAGLGSVKRPDLLVFRASDRRQVRDIVNALGGVEELPFAPEANPDVQALLSLAVIAVECENSLWKAKLMPDYDAQLRPMKRLGGLPGLSKSAVLPTVIIKEEDIPPLAAWQAANRVPIHVWQVFYDMAIGISFDRALSLIEGGYILPTEQTFQAPGGATTRKAIFKIYHHYSYLIGESVEEPQLAAKSITDPNGHILPYVHFVGGRIQLAHDLLDVLHEAANA